MRTQLTIPDLISITRILFSISLCFTQPFSLMFYILYISAGISDMLDGYIARKTDYVTEHGALVDTIGDAIFLSVCLYVLIPVIVFPSCIIIWIGIIFVIKVINIISSMVVYHRIVTVHSMLNKLTGFLLFLMPLCIQMIPLQVMFVPVCIIASIAAIQEGHLIRTHRI